MNAVNLIPPDRRRNRRLTLSVGKPFLGLLAALGLVLVATVLYVNAHNRVTQRRTELAQVSAGVAQWTAVASSYSRFTTAAQQHAQQLGDVRQLAASRFDWSQLLGQIAGLMPAQAQLASVQATTPAGVVPASGATASGGASSAGSGIQLTACATSQSVVAQTMVQLRRISGVASVTLASSSSSDSSGSTASAGSSGSGSSGCRLPVQFQVSLTFATSSGTSSSTTGTTATPTTSPTTATTTSAAAAEAPSSATRSSSSSQ